MRKFFRTSFHIKRLNWKLKRYSNIIGVFPNEQSLLRLMGSVLIERNEVLWTGKAVFSHESYQALRISDVLKRLSEIADIQHTLRIGWQRFWAGLGLRSRLPKGSTTDDNSSAPNRFS